MARWVGVMAAFVLGAAAQADPAPPALHGIALGMTPAEAKGAAGLACETPAYSSDLACKDPGDGSDYRALFSAGDPSIALSVQHDFCSDAPIDTVLARTLDRLHAPADHAHRDPNGYTIDLGGDDEAVLNADNGTCQAGGRHYVVLVRSNGLIRMSADKAVERAKAALH